MPRRCSSVPTGSTLAKTAFAFVTSRMEKDGRLIHSYRAGQAKAPATASDYANMIWGALRLHQATNERAYLAAAERWAAVLDRRYWIADAGGYAFTADDTPDVIVRMRSAHDDATPNANALMISNLVALNLLTGKQAYLDRAHAIPDAFAPDLGRNALGHCGVLAGYYDLLAPQHVVVIAPALGGPARSPCRAPCSSCLCRVRCSRSWARISPSPAPRWPARPRSRASPPPTPASARSARCPVTDPDALLELLRQQRAATGS